MTTDRPFDLAIFDLDGTIVNTISSLASSANAVLTSFGHKPLPEEAFPALVGYGAKNLIKSVMEQVGIDVTTTLLSAYYAKYLDIFAERSAWGVTVYPKMDELIKKLREAGYLTAVFTNKPHGPAIKVIDAVFPAGHFNEVVGQREGYPQKPDPEEALALALRLGVSPSRTVIIGDGDTDIRTGQNAGMTTIAVCWGYRPAELLSELKPDYLIFEPDALYNVLLPPPRA